MSDPIRLRAQFKDGEIELRALVFHPMESGFRKLASGALAPAHHITDIEVLHEGSTVLRAQWGPSVSKDPILHIRFAASGKGGRIVLRWTDNLGGKGSGETTVL